jgi:hypothetical protein
MGSDLERYFELGLGDKTEPLLHDVPLDVQEKEVGCIWNQKQ